MLCTSSLCALTGVQVTAQLSTEAEAGKTKKQCHLQADDKNAVL